MVIDKSRKFQRFFDPLKDSTKREINFLVLHHIEANSADHAIKQLLDHEVSSHFLIDENGKIFELVDESNVAYHAGVSFWNGCNGLNKSSIGIEFINSAPFEKNFEVVQMQAGVELCRYLIAKYFIAQRNVVGHCDIAYFAQNSELGFAGNLDRKQDPSHLFDWKFLAENGVGIFPKNTLEVEEVALFRLKSQSEQIALIKKNLSKFGYLVNNFSNEFDFEMQALVRVFNRHYNQKSFAQGCSDVWSSRSEAALNYLVSQL